jgi:hypothetical protein
MGSHLVARQVIEVVGADRLACETLAARTSQCAAMVAAAIARGLDDVDVPEEQIRIGRVELDLGPCEAGMWEETLAREIRRRLPDKIIEAIGCSAAERCDPRQSALLMLDEFARSGRLPWWCVAADSPRGAVAVLASEGCPPEAVQGILTQPSAIERLANQLPGPELLSLIRLARPGFADETALVAALAEVSLAELHLPLSQEPALPASLWHAALAMAAAPHPTAAAEKRSHAAHNGEAEVDAYKAAVIERLRRCPGRDCDRGPTSAPGGTRLHWKAANPPISHAQDAEHIATVPSRQAASHGEDRPSEEAGIAAFAPGLDGTPISSFEAPMEANPAPEGSTAAAATVADDRTGPAQGAGSIQAPDRPSPQSAHDARDALNPPVSRAQDAEHIATVPSRQAASHGEDRPSAEAGIAAIAQGFDGTPISSFEAPLEVDPAPEGSTAAAATVADDRIGPAQAAGLIPAPAQPSPRSAHDAHDALNPPISHAQDAEHIATVPSRQAASYGEDRPSAEAGIAASAEGLDGTLISSFAAPARPSPRSAHDEHDALLVLTAGLPLAWPFLPALFASLGLLEETGQAFEGVAAPHRAAALLHYLATGDRSCPEQSLPLAKILVGLDLDAVHQLGEPLSEKEAASADALLEAMLGHAPMLGKISSTGLRHSFLIRRGSLCTRDGHWLLRVERRGIDILLDRLPWSFSWVCLPWMEAPLQVEW